MTILTIIQNVSDDLGLDRPTSIIGNSNDDVRQLLQMANKEGKDLVNRYKWQFKQIEATFISVALALQGKMTTLAGADFLYVINDTLWDRTASLPILGPIVSRDWQALQAFPVTGPYTQFRIQNDNLLFDPAPAAGLTIAFEYLSEAFCETNAGSGQSAWLADTDVGRCDESIMELGIIWRWLQRKQLDYSEDFTLYERRVADAMAQDGGKMTQRLDGRTGDRVPGVFVPEGSWSIT